MVRVRDMVSASLSSAAFESPVLIESRKKLKQLDIKLSMTR